MWKMLSSGIGSDPQEPKQGATLGYFGSFSDQRTWKASIEKESKGAPVLKKNYITPSNGGKQNFR